MRTAAVLIGTLALGRAWANEPSVSTSGIESCAAIADDPQRLACFDREIALLKQRGAAARSAPSATAAAAAAAPATSSSAAAPPSSPELTPEQRMGLAPGRILQLQKSASAPDLKELTAKVEGVSANNTGRRVFTLDNGQTWEQVEPDPDFPAKPGETVRIMRAALGSYFMSAGTHFNTRVRRLR